MKKEQKFKISIDQKTFEVKDQFINGIQIKKKVGSPANYGVWLKVNGPNPDKEVGDVEFIDLSETGIENFFTGSKTTIEG